MHGTANPFNVMRHWLLYLPPSLQQNLRDRRDTAAAQAFFEGAIQTSNVTASRVTTDTAKCSPPALRAVLPMAEHRSSN